MKRISAYPLREEHSPNVELDNFIDGISLMDLAAATHREERDKKKSVMEQLKSQPRTEHKKKAPQKSAEREI